MTRWIFPLLLAAGCDDKDTADCGSTAAFVYGAVTGDGASDPSLAVLATSDSGEVVEADWYGEQDGELVYELNLTAGSWTIQADTDACEGAPSVQEVDACEEYSVDLVTGCR